MAAGLGLALGLVLGGGACDFTQDIQTYCAASHACACDGGACCVTLNSPCDDRDGCCGDMQCVDGFCQLPGSNPDAGPAGDAGPDGGADAGPTCGANGDPCLSGADCCSAACSATTCCAPAGFPCGFAADCCDPNASCSLLADGGPGCVLPTANDGGASDGGAGDGGAGDGGH